MNSSSPVAIAVRPVNDGDSDQASLDLATVIGQGLGVVDSHHVVDSDLAAEVLEYHDSEERSDPRMATVEEALAKAKELYFQFRYVDSWAAVERALAPLKDLDRTISGPLFVDAYLTRALIAKARGERDEVRTSFRQALLINPKLELSSQDYPPSVIAMFEEERGLLAKRPAGSIAVSTSPAAAKVYLNGILQGETPIELARLPQGSYRLLIRANRYQPVERTIRVEGGRRVELKPRLKWASKKKGGQEMADEDRAALVRQGLHIADTLKVDKVILVDVDAVDRGRVSARMIDRKFGVGLKPIVVDGILEPEGRAGRLAKMTLALAQQIGASVEVSPEKLIDPPGVSDPALLGQRKRPPHRDPIFWSAIGVLLAGAIGGGLAAAMSGGGGGPGNIRVQFR